MGILSKKTHVRRLLKDKRIREHYLDTFIKEHIAMQIKAARKQRDGLSQQKLAEQTGTKQSAISRMEDGNYGKMSIPTLLKLASKFEIALFVEFMPWNKFLRKTETLDPDRLELPPIEEVKTSLEAWANGIPPNEDVRTMTVTKCAPAHDNSKLTSIQKVGPYEGRLEDSSPKGSLACVGGNNGR